MNIVTSRIPIFCNDHFIFKSAVFYEHRYYCLSNLSNYLYIYDESFCFLSKVEIDYSCDSMTFCYEKNLFYLHCPNTHKIIVLDIYFKVIKEISMTLSDNIVSMYYSDAEHLLYLITNHFIFTLNKMGKIQKVLSRCLLNKNNLSFQKPISAFTTFSILQGDFYLCYIRNTSSYLGKVQKGELVEEYFIDTHCSIPSILNYEDNTQLFLCQKHNYIFDISLSKENCNHFEKNEYNYLDCNFSQEIESIAEKQIRNITFTI